MRSWRIAGRGARDPFVRVKGKPVSFKPIVAAQNLLRSGLHIAKGGGQLCLYEDGRYVLAEELLRKYLSDQVGLVWTKHHVAELLGFLYDSAPELWEKPLLRQVNLANGILNLDTLQINSHDHSWLSTVQVPVTFDPSADCPAFDAFLRQVVDPDAVTVVYEFIGHLLVPDTAYQKALFLVGPGANGKSTLLNVVQALLGRENIAARTLQSLASERFAKADLYGKLANVGADLPSTRLQATDVFKALTGGDPMEAERKFKDAFTFTPFARLLFSANEVPPSGDGSYGWLRRWLVVELARRFAPEQQDRGLLAKLTAPSELSGLLNRALLAYEQLRTRGHFEEPPSIKRGLDTMRAASDPVAVFISESCLLASNARIKRADLYQAYTTWAQGANRGVMSRQRFNAAVRARGDIGEVTEQGQDVFTGIALADRADPLQVVS